MRRGETGETKGLELNKRGGMGEKKVGMQIKEHLRTELARKIVLERQVHGESGRECVLEGIV